MFVRLMLVFHFLIITVLPQQGYSQSREQDANIPYALTFSVSNLKTGDYVRIKIFSHGNVEGQLLDVMEDTLYLSADGKDGKVLLNNIDMLWARGRATKTGATVGATVGLIGGAVLGIFAAGVGSMDSGEDPEYVGSALLGGLLAGGILALLGAGIGATIPKWHLKYESYESRWHAKD